MFHFCPTEYPPPLPPTLLGSIKTCLCFRLVRRDYGHKTLLMETKNGSHGRVYADSRTLTPTQIGWGMCCFRRYAFLHESRRKPPNQFHNSCVFVFYLWIMALIAVCHSGKTLENSFYFFNKLFKTDERPSLCFCDASTFHNNPNFKQKIDSC